MNITTVRRGREKIAIDHTRQEDLCARMGQAAALDVIGRAVEELAVRLTHCEQCWRMHEQTKLRKTARSIIGIADQLGMLTLAQVARDVVCTVDQSDDVAIAATLTRLIQVGEKSLLSLWDADDLSV